MILFSQFNFRSRLRAWIFSFRYGKDAFTIHMLPALNPNGSLQGRGAILHSVNDKLLVLGISGGYNNEKFTLVVKPVPLDTPQPVYVKPYDPRPISVRARAWWKHYKFVHRYGVNKHRHEHYGVKRFSTTQNLIDATFELHNDEKNQIN